MMKKFISTLLTLLVIVACLSVTGQASAASSVSVAPAYGADTASRGDTVVFNINVYGGDTTESGVHNFDIKFDVTGDATVTVAPVQVAGFGQVIAQASGSGYRVFSYGASGEVGATTAITVATVTCKINDTAALGSKVTVTVTGASITEYVSGNPCTTGVGAGSDAVTIVCDHQYGAWTVTKAATCVDEGEQERTCSVCGDVDTGVIPVDPTNHVGPFKWDSNAVNHWHKCGACHQVTDSAVAHKWGAWSEVKAATETQPGEKVRVCTDCGREEKGVIPALGHTCSFGAWTEVTPATCTAEGQEKRVCSCGNFETRPIAKKAHQPDSKWYGDADNHWHLCKVCGGKVDVAAHTWNTKWNADETNHWHVCDVCGMHADEAAHDFHWQTEVEATKDKDGWRVYICRICGYVLKGEAISKDKDDVPQTGDITPHITMAVVATVSMLGAVAYVFKRKAAK